MVRVKLALVSAIAVSLLTTSPHAYAESDIGSVDLGLDREARIPTNFMRMVLSSANGNNGIRWAVDEFDRLDSDKNGITQADIDRKKVNDRLRRKDALARKIGFVDIDEDGLVLDTEMREGALAQAWGAPLNFVTRLIAERMYSSAADRRMEVFAAADTDGSNSVTAAEIDAYVESLPTLKRLEEQWEKSGSLETFVLDLDLDGDGSVAKAEYLRTLSRVSPALLNRKAFQEASDETLPETCKVPQPSRSDRVVLAGIYEGSAYADVSSVGPDYDTKAGEIHVAADSDPLYLIITNYKGTVWRLHGAVDRVSHIVLANAANGEGSPNASAVQGVDSSKVSFVSSWNCVYPFSKITDFRAVRAQKMVETLVGRKPDVLVAMYSVGSILLPEGKADQKTTIHKPEPLDRNLVSRFKLFGQGVIKFDPLSLVAAQPVESKPVLPAGYGIRQLVQEGKLEAVETKHSRLGSEGYLIKEKILFPSGLYGAHGVTFLLPRDVPQPSGDLGHSCLLWEDTGQPVRQGQSHCTS